MTATASIVLSPLSDIPESALVLVQARGKGFTIGSKELEDSQPLTKITFDADFYIGQYPVTQALWQQVMGNNPSEFKGSRRPVERVSWDMICGKAGFLARLNGLPAIQDYLAAAGLRDWRFQLPAEAQWEYAARGGPQGQEGFTHAGRNDINEVAWYGGNSHAETKPVGLKAPNQLGLYDMSGNVWEWCADAWVNNYKGLPGNGQPRPGRPEDTVSRVMRGGGYFGSARDCRAAYRYCGRPDDRNSSLGFRLLLCPGSPAGI